MSYLYPLLKQVQAGECYASAANGFNAESVQSEAAPSQTKSNHRLCARTQQGWECMDTFGVKSDAWIMDMVSQAVVLQYTALLGMSLLLPLLRHCFRHNSYLIVMHYSEPLCHT